MCMKILSNNFEDFFLLYSFIKNVFHKKAQKTFLQVMFTFILRNNVTEFHILKNIKSNDLIKINVVPFALLIKKKANK